MAKRSEAVKYLLGNPGNWYWRWTAIGPAFTPDKRLAHRFNSGDEVAAMRGRHPIAFCLCNTVALRAARPKRKGKAKK